MKPALREKIRRLPRRPGVYLMKDREGKVLYVGKARDLRKRVLSYAGGRDSRPMIPFLVSRVEDLECIVTETEKEALILENTLIKEHRPRYNVDFRDDKAYFHLRIDPKAPFPRFQLVRRPKKDGARYLGPYPSSAAAKETLRFLQGFCPLRTCRDAEFRSRKRPCLERQIGRCLAPCTGGVDPEAYRGLVQDALSFLEGRERHLLEDLRKRMGQAAEDLAFEEAARLRDRIAAVEHTLERQHMDTPSARNEDAFGLHWEDALTQVCLLSVRGGRLLRQRPFPLVRLALPAPEILSSLLRQFYADTPDIPDTVFLPAPLEDQAVLAEWLADRKGRAVSVTAPARGRGRELVRLAERNARELLAGRAATAGDPETALAELQERAGLSRRPNRIAGVDISNLGGTSAVGSLVTFVEGRPWKAGYRRFRIRTVPGADDYAMLYEVLTRYLRSGADLPDLLLVDGGRGQLGVALATLKDLGVTGVDVLAIAKERIRPPGKASGRPSGEPSGGAAGPEREEDRLYRPGRKNPLRLRSWPALRGLVQRIRDEAHRFAVSYHRRLREKKALASALDRVPGLGPAKTKTLLSRFGDVRTLRSASPEELLAVPGIGLGLAGRIRDRLAGEDGSRTSRSGEKQGPAAGNRPRPEKERDERP